jgi:Cys-rich protein (TIGR01571 family)
VPDTDALTRGSHVDSNSAVDENKSADDQQGGQHAAGNPGADEKNMSVHVSKPSPESADERDEVNAAERANAKKEGAQTNSPSDATLASAQKGLTEAQAGAAPAHENDHRVAAPVALSSNDDLSDSIPEKSPVAVLVGDVTVGTMKDNDKDGQATQQLDDIIWDVEELQRIAWKVGARLGTFYKDEGFRHVIINVVVYLAGVFIALGLYFMCFQHREVSVEQEFRYGLCECFGDFRISLCGIFCPAIRWADTVSEEKGGLLSFSYALLLMMGLGFLVFRPFVGVFAWIAIVIVGVYYRQRIRQKYGLECDTTPSLIEDFFVWCCCSYCALVQEARQVDDFEGRKNSEYTEESDDFKMGTLRLSETDTGTSW